MAISADRQHSTSRLPPGPAPADETPLQVIESAWCEAGSELAYYHNHRDVRLSANERERRAQARALGAVLARDWPAAEQALRELIAADDIEDAAALMGDGRVVLAQRHGRAVGAAIELAETGRRREDAPEQAAFMVHGPTCDACLVGGRCRVSDELMQAADAEGWQRAAVAVRGRS